MLKHFNSFNGFVGKENRLISQRSTSSGGFRGGRFFRSSSLSSGGGTRSVSSPTSTAVASGGGGSTPQAKQGLTFGSTLQKAIDTAKKSPSPFDLSRFSSPSGAGRTTTGSRLSFEVPKASPPPSPPTSFGDVTKPESTGLQFGSKLLEAIRGAPSDAFDISKAQSAPGIQDQISALSRRSTPSLFSAVPTAGGGIKTSVSSTTSPLFNIDAVRGALGAGGVSALSTGRKGVLDFEAADRLGTGTGAGVTDVKEEKIEEPVVEEPVVPEAPQTAEQVLQTFQQQLLDLLAPSAEEQKLQKQLDDELGSLELGLVDLEGRPVPLASITGQQSQLERRSTVRTAPLERNLARLQNARLGRVRALETALGFSEGALSRSFQKTQTDFSNRVALATKGLRYDEENDRFFRDESLLAPSDPVDKANLEAGLRKEFNGLSRVQNFTEMSSQVAKMEAAFKLLQETGGGANFVDQALITIFNKINDPGSVVRESEFARSATNLSLLQRIDALIIRQAKGGVLNTEARQELLSTARAMFEAEKGAFDELSDFYTSIADSNDIDVGNIIFIPDTGSTVDLSSADGAQNTVTVFGADGQLYEYDLSDPAQVNNLREGVTANFFSQDVLQNL